MIIPFFVRIVLHYPLSFFPATLRTFLSGLGEVLFHFNPRELRITSFADISSKGKRVKGECKGKRG